MLHTPATRARQNDLALDECVAGTVERVTFHSDTSGFCVLQVRARGYRRPVTVVGHVATIAIGECIEARGAWQRHPSHGAQFRAGTLAVSNPTSADDLCRFLGSGLIKGVGPALAKRLVASFGEQVLDIIERDPDALARVHGIGASRARVIAEAWNEHRSLRDLAAFLRDHRIPELLLTRIHRAYGRAAIDTISSNPYRLALDLTGFGFAEADRIASRIGVERRAAIRLRAGIASVIAEAVEDGHCGLPTDEALERARHLLGVSVTDLAPVVDAQCAAGELVADEVEGRDCLFSRGLYSAELYVAARLRELSRGALPWGKIEPAYAISKAEKALGVTFSASQREALEGACRSKVLVMTGGPGVGKTTLVRGLLHILAERNVDAALCAPTGRAARRLSAVTGRDAKTIHRLIGAALGGLRRGSDVPVACDLLVVDEASMVDVRLMAALLRALPDHAALLIVGDADQLPSIGPGQVLSDLIRSRAVPVARLADIFRQESPEPDRDGCSRDQPGRDARSRPG